MAHHITDSDTMISVGETPWHGLGTVLDAPPTIADAIKLAGLDWRVEIQPNFTRIGGSDVPTPSQTIVRVDTDASGAEVRSVLASVGPEYVPLQNDAAFAWFQPWVDSGHVTIETAGTLDAGRRVWILAKIAGDPIAIAGDDIVKKYILLAHAHDGSLAIRAGLTAVRVVCHNTLSAAIGVNPANGRKVADPNGIFKILHRKNAVARLDDVAAEIGRIDDRFAQMAEIYRTLAQVEMPGAEDAYVEFLGAVYRQTPEQIRKGRRYPVLAELLESGIGQDEGGASRRTWWNAYNTLTEYHTHTAGRSAETRANANAFGEGAAVLRRGIDVALAMATRTYSIGEVLGEWSDAANIADANHPDAAIA